MAYTSRPSGLRAALAWLQATMTRQANLSRLSARDLGDIGIRSGALSHAIDREVGGRRSVDFGWRMGH